MNWKHYESLKRKESSCNISVVYSVSRCTDFYSTLLRPHSMKIHYCETLMLKISASLSATPGRKAQLPLCFLPFPPFRPANALSRPVSRRCSSDSRKLSAVMYNNGCKFAGLKPMKASACSLFFFLFFKMHPLTRCSIYEPMNYRTMT